MAAKSRWILFLGDQRLAVARVNRGQIERSDSEPYVRPITPETAEETAALCQRLLEERHYRSEPVLLALGSSWCPSAAIAIPSPRQARKRSAVGFLVEPHFPWSLEEAVIDYELLASNRAFAVSAEVRPLAALIAALEERGITVTSIAPMARLALEHHLQTAAATESRYTLLWRNEETVDLWLIEHNRPVVWNWLPYEFAAVARAVGRLALCEGVDLRVVGRNLPPEFLEALAAKTGLATDELPAVDFEDPLVAAAHEGAAVLEGRRAAAIEFRRDQLAASDRNRSIRSHLRLVQGSILILLAVLGLALFTQGRQTDRLREEQDRQQTALFRRLFPEQRVPVAIHGHLESELVRLKGMRGERPDLPDSIPFLSILQPLLKTLPGDLRYRLLEMRVENGQLYLVGQVRAHGDADRIAEALRGAGLDVPSPNTNRLEKEGVEFRIAARRVRRDVKQLARKGT